MTNSLTEDLKHQMTCEITSTTHTKTLSKATYFAKTLPQSQDSKDNESLHLYVQHICKVVVIATKFPT